MSHDTGRNFGIFKALHPIRHALGKAQLAAYLMRLAILHDLTTLSSARGMFANCPDILTVLEVAIPEVIGLPINGLETSQSRFMVDNSIHCSQIAWELESDSYPMQFDLMWTCQLSIVSDFLGWRGGQRGPRIKVDEEEIRKRKGKVPMVDEAPNILDMPLSVPLERWRPDGHIKVDWSDRIKVFEEGFDKAECELFNHEVKDLAQGVSHETVIAHKQAQEFMNSFVKKIREGLEDIIPKLGVWTLLIDYQRNELADEKLEKEEVVMASIKAQEAAKDVQEKFEEVSEDTRNTKSIGNILLTSPNAALFVGGADCPSLCLCCWLTIDDALFIAGLALGELRSVGDLYDFKTIAVLFFIGLISVAPTVVSRKQTHE
eukprot:Gb_10116 [translate_table: standard]